VLAAVALSACLALAGGSARPATASQQQAPAAVPGELIVGFEPGSSRAEQRAAVLNAGGTRAETFPEIRAALVRVAPSETADAMKQLLGNPDVRYVERNHIVSIAATPNDPSFGQLWGMHNTGQTGGTADADIDAPEAWDVSTGSSGVVVGVTDTGVDFGHPDLAAQQWVNAGENCGSTDPGAACADRSDGVDDDGNGYVDDWRGWDFVNGDNNPVDDHNHGTHVSGTIGAVGSNGTGVVGVNWNVKVMALKFLSSAGSGTTADAIAATMYAADMGAHVSSNSWGGGPFDQSLLDAIEYGASRGMLFVAASGNDGKNNDPSPTYPSSYDSEAIVSVAATDHNDGLAFFSNYGAKSVDLGAPGVNILSTTVGGGYQAFQGTSMATPHVAGVAALLKARYPDASPYGLKALLLRSVDPVASLAGKTTTGGRLNAFNAVSCVDSPKVWLGAPGNGFVAGVGDTVPIRVVGSSCASAAGLANVEVMVNGAPVAVSAASPDLGLYTASFTPAAEGPLTVTATVSAGGTTASQTATGTAYLNYTCQDVPMSWVDVTGGTRLVGAGADDGFSTLGIGFPVSFYGQTYTTAYVSSNGFLALGSSAGANTPGNAAIPNTAAPNGIIAPYWDDLDPSAGGGVYAGVSGAAPDRTLHIEWHDVPHFTLSTSGRVTVELSLKENGEVRFQYLDTDFGNPNWNAGASATAGIERPDGVIGRQVSFAQPQLTAGRALSCSYGTPPPPHPPPPQPTVTTTSLDGGQVGVAYSQALEATGGTPPYAWSLDSGSLPAGLSLDSGSGAITGTPTSSGTASFTAKVTDSLAQSDTQGLSIAVSPAPAIDTTSLPGGSLGSAYSTTLQASGGTTPYAWSLASGSLPPGLTLGTATGAVTGTPTSAGTFAFTARVTDALGQTATQPLSIFVAGPLQVTQAPSSTTILAGTPRSGSAGSLAADDNSYFEVNSTTSGTKTTDWYGSFTGVTNSLSNLRVSFKGKNSRSCTQVVFIWRWSTSSWVQLSSRSVGTTEVAISNLVPSGSAANYVSGTSGDGEVRVRVRCRRSGSSFFASGDLLRIDYERPATLATALGPRLRAFVRSG
jgi:serine protease